MTVGSNPTFNVAVCPGFNVTGKVVPDSAKPAPVRAAAFMVTGKVPVDVKVKGCSVAAVPTTTLPNVTLVALMVSAGTAAFNCSAKVLDTLPAFAVIVTACATATGDTVAANPALVAFGGTVTVLGTVTAELLLDRFTVNPSLDAGAVSVTVQTSVPDPVKAPLLQYSVLNAVETVPVVPVPLRAITGVPSVEESVAIVSCPVAVPAAAGLNCTLRL